MTTTIRRTVGLRGLSKGLELMKLFQTLDDKVDVSCYAIFLLVCFQDGITNENILSYFPKMTKSRVSRNVHILCDVAKTRKDRVGLNLLKQEINPNDYRQRTLVLTEKGKSVKNKVLKLLGY
tara:strand:+ start:351 stop:716 length:366 start_codon:yes stop_codon:yes gene_type:complete